MSAYLQLNLVVLGALLLLVLLVSWWLRRSGRPQLRWSAIALAAAALVLITAVFDNVMIAVGLFSYAPSTLTGAYLGLAPIEDFAYPIAAALLIPALWHAFERPERGAEATK